MRHRVRAEFAPRLAHRPRHGELPRYRGDLDAGEHGGGGKEYRFAIRLALGLAASAGRIVCHLSAVAKAKEL
jgi:hypothetical protein